MTQIKKFAWYGSALAFAAVAAVALLIMSPASQTEAAITNIDVLSPEVEPGDLNAVGVQFDAGGPVLWEILDPGAEFVANGSDVLQCADNDGSCDANVAAGTMVVGIKVLAGASAGEIRVRATDLGDFDADSISFDVLGPPPVLNEIMISGPASVANGGSATYAISAFDEDGELIAVDVEVQTINGEIEADDPDCLIGGSDLLTSCDITTKTDADNPALVEVNEDGDVGDIVKITAFRADAPLIVDTFEAVIAGSLDSITVDAPATVAVGSISEVTLVLTDAEGNPVADGTTISAAASGDGVLLCGAATTDGEVSCVFVAPGDPANIVITATSGAVIGTANVQVVAEAALNPAVADEGISLTVVVNTSTIEEVVAAAGDPISIWITVEGEFVGYIPGAPDFVNAAFVAETGGELASGTPIVVVK